MGERNDLDGSSHIGDDFEGGNVGESERRIGGRGKTTEHI